MRKNQHRLLVGLLLTAVLLVGAYYRFVGLNWDDFTHLHPDERFLTQVLSAVGSDLNPTTMLGGNEQLVICQERYPDTNGRGLYFDGYFDARCSALNPNNIGHGLYVYGTLPLFIADIASDRFADLTYQWSVFQAERAGETPPAAFEFDIWRGYFGGHLVWRALNGLADLGTALLLFLIGRRLHGRWVGLLAAALYVAAPLPIQKAHFATVNSMAAFFATFALYFAVRVQDKGRMGDYFAFGVAFAAALASRINLAPLVILILAAAAFRMAPMLDRRLAWGEREQLFTRNFGGLVLAGIVTIIGFRIFNPYAFEGPGYFGIFPNEAWLEDIGEAQYLVSGAAESPPNWQWVNRTGYVFPFTNMVLWGMGVALGLSAWIGWAWAGYRVVRGQTGAMRNLLPFAWVLVYFAWIGNLWVMSMRYYLPLYPALTLLGAWVVVEAWKRVRLADTPRPILRYSTAALIVLVVGFTHLWALMFTNIYRNQLTRVQATHYVWEQIPGDFAMRVEGAPAETPLINIPVFNRSGIEEQIETQASLLEENIPFVEGFTVPADGVIRAITVPHLGDPADDPDDETLLVAINSADGVGPLVRGTLAANLSRQNHPLGDTYEIEFEEPLEVTAGESYELFVEVLAGGPIITAGSVVSHEGNWDDPVPTVVCSLPEGITLEDNPPPGLKTARNCDSLNAYSGLVNGYPLHMALDDIELKRDRMKTALDNSDYLIISSNRFYDTLSRIPARWPMSNAYYDALFSGELGYELEAVFQETFEFGPFRVSDQHLPIHNTPAWFNEFEAEEAFHVYDHPVVFIFRKTDAYQPETMRTVLDTVPLQRETDVLVGLSSSSDIIGVNPLFSLAADETPTQLNLKDWERELQYQNGTWSERFRSDGLVNSQPLVTVTLWWAVIVGFGLVAWPLLFAMFPALPDRGYSLSKFAGLLLVSWVAWFLTSINVVRLWSGTGVLVTLVVLGAINLAIAWRSRDSIRNHVIDHWPRLLAIELITFAAFLIFLGVRATNPDLWHPAFGGEKPMDFAYFNAVLRSSSFPPLDPWHAGGYINYYYFGFVIVGAPVLLLGVVPAVAYNLIIPTLFAVTGMGAFSVAFNIVRSWTSRESQSSTRSLRGSAWTAGMMALLLAVVLGNLNTPRVFLNGVVQLGGFTPASDYEAYLLNEYRAENEGQEPTDEALFRIVEQAENPGIGDLMAFRTDQTFDAFGGFFSGLQAMGEGQAPSIPSNRWHWASTRVLAEPPASAGGAITEIPYFTFLYGDLHAHMIAMPMQFLVLVFLLNELLLAGSNRRGLLPSVLAIGFGAMTVGMLRATNTWDWPTYLLLGVLGLGFAWWLKWQTISRGSLVDMLVRIGGFISLSVWLSLPYTRWYAAIYTTALPWEGTTSPLWAYLIIHGLFLFLAVSLLVWETGRWLRSIPVTAVRGRLWVIYLVLIVIASVLLVSWGLYLAGWPVTLVALPLTVWAGVLFFRPDQSRQMQFVLVMLALALAITLGVEYIVIEGDIQRQNTVFKFYMQVWLLFSVVGGVTIAWLMEHARDWNLGLNASWFGTLGFLVAVAALYPLMATQARSLDRLSPEVGLTLDGMAYMAESSYYELVDSQLGRGEVIDMSVDYDIIRWLQENVEGTPIIMEAQSEREYLWGSRISIYTGLPTVQGWNWHQRQQRTFAPMPSIVWQRVANMNAFYETTDVAEAAFLLNYYDVSYVIVGELEKARYPAEGINKLFQMANMGVLERVYSENGGTIFRVNPDEVARLALTFQESREVAQAAQ